MRPKSKASSSSQAAIKLDSESAKDTKLTEKGEMTTERPAENERRRLLEWFDLEYTDGLENSGWKAALAALRGQSGCKGIFTSRPVEPPERLWIIIVSAIRGFQIFWERLLHTTRGDTPDVHLIYKLGVSYEHVIKPRIFAHPNDIYEIWTVYFPDDLSGQAKSRLEDLCGPKIGHMSGFEDQSLGPMDGLRTTNHGWLEGEIQYEGQAAKRLVYFFLWESEEAEKLYKETQRWYKKTKNGRELRMAIEISLDDLEECGMLGFETKHGRFEEIEHTWSL
ncbi:hypothetical protein M432DRAFT_659226 [Thermoascus aurantiacus ATCC 26904]